MQFKGKRPRHTNGALCGRKSTAYSIVDIPDCEASDEDDGAPGCEALDVFLDDGVDHAGFDYGAGFYANDCYHDTYFAHILAHDLPICKGAGNEGKLPKITEWSINSSVTQ